MEENMEIENLIKEIRKGDYDSLGQLEHIHTLLQRAYSEAKDTEKDTLASFASRLLQRAMEFHQSPFSTPVLRLSLENLANHIKSLEDLRILDKSIRVDQSLLVMDERVEGCHDDIMAHASEYRDWERCVIEWDLEHRMERTERLEALALVIHNHMVTFFESENAVMGLFKGHPHTGWSKYNLTRALGDKDMAHIMFESSTPLYHEDPSPDQLKSWADKYLFALKRDTNPVTLVDVAVQWTRPPKQRLESQKAKGIQAAAECMDEDTYAYWHRPVATFLTMEEAQSIPIGLLMESLAATLGWMGQTWFSKNSVFIRTCPASPRPGALKNAEAKSPVEILNAVRELSALMLDDTDPSYDPDGALCVMRKIDAMMSAVLPSGSRVLTVGPSFNGATSAAGSNIQITLSDNLALSIKGRVDGMSIKDGDVEEFGISANLPHHELEFVFDKLHVMTDVNVDKTSKTKMLKGLLPQANPNYNHRPTLVQVRGISGEKRDVGAPPNVEIEGKVMPVWRGNIRPDGKIVAFSTINVGKGDLDDCFELEQMIENEEVPDNPLIVVPSGTDHCHAAGVALQASISIVYGVTEEDLINHIRLTEVEYGWVVGHDNPDELESQSYKPEQYAEFFIMGFEDGDQRWDYQNITLSQFFHEHMVGPKQDPRFIAYLGGVFSSWITKATIAVAMGEARHAWGGQDNLFAPKHGLAHIFISTLMAGGYTHKGGFPEFDPDMKVHNTGSYQYRESYYKPFKNKYLGVGAMSEILKAYYGIFSENEWDGSYGGSKYAGSVQLASNVVELVETVMNDMEGGSGMLAENYKALLDAVNRLESAQHNTGWFFNKFATKTYMDIGTAHHKNLETVSMQYTVAVSYHYLFYKQMNEEHMIWDGFIEDEEWQLYHAVGWDRSVLSNSQIETAFFQIMNYLNNAQPDDSLIGLFEDGYLPSWARNMLVETTEYFTSHGNQEGYDRAIHQRGKCGIAGCPKGVCKEYQQSILYPISQQGKERLAWALGALTHGNQHALRPLNDHAPLTHSIKNLENMVNSSILMSEFSKNSPFGPAPSDDESTIFSRANQPSESQPEPEPESPVLTLLSHWKKAPKSWTGDKWLRETSNVTPEMWDKIFDCKHIYGSKSHMKTHTKIVSYNEALGSLQMMTKEALSDMSQKQIMSILATIGRAMDVTGRMATDKDKDGLPSKHGIYDERGCETGIDELLLGPLRDVWFGVKTLSDSIWRLEKKEDVAFCQYILGNDSIPSKSYSMSSDAFIGRQQSKQPVTLHLLHNLLIDEFLTEAAPHALTYRSKRESLGLSGYYFGVKDSQDQTMAADRAYKALIKIFQKTPSSNAKETLEVLENG